MCKQTCGAGWLAVVVVVGADLSGGAAVAHVHGAGRIAMVVDGAAARVELGLPAEEVLGRETPARSETEREADEAALRAASQRLPAVLMAPAGCVWDGLAAAVEWGAGGHAEVRISGDLGCAGDLAGQTVEVRTAPIGGLLLEIEVVSAANAQRAKTRTVWRSEVL